ncbi:hypothetical protein [Humisphaera borealis]|uniref:Uncharacterized protein n=1 Tax=Humisphaera borealis TaxID=2807512 RepID=A0A7M2WQN8_9BACT|nr:hypothetical protein [Humisphaera borealis]QOV87786.1 hypothetical protein IPV69_16015 [Humisphaera borealis]
MDVFWSTVYPVEVYADYHMLYKEPRPLIHDLVPSRGPDNPHDFFACPAFHLHMANTFVVRSIVDANVGIHLEGFSALDDKSSLTAQLFSYMHPTRKGFRTILFDHRMLFFCAKPLVLATYPAFMHRSEVQTKLHYVPAAYDISKWLRPLQGTFEVSEDTRSISIREEDPLYYIKFETTEKVRLRRFQMVPELHAITHGCVHYKLFRQRSTLERVYAAFTGSHLDRRVLKLITENLLD